MEGRWLRTGPVQFSPLQACVPACPRYGPANATGFVLSVRARVSGSGAASMWTCSSFLASSQALEAWSSYRVAGRSLLRPCERRPAAQARSPAARTHGACQISVIIFISSGFVPEWVFTRIRQHWSARRVGEALAQDMLSWCLQFRDSLTLLLQGLLCRLELRLQRRHLAAHP